MTLKKSNPGCDCCATPECNLCSTAPLRVTMTFSGFWNNGLDDCSGDCPNLDGTYVLDLIPPAVAVCQWIYNGTFDCGGDDVTVTISLDLWSLSGTTWYECRVDLIHTIRPIEAHFVYRWSQADSFPFNCLATRTLTLLGSAVHLICNGPTTCQLN